MSLEFLDTLIDDELKTLCVPIDHCISVRTGKVDPTNVRSRLSGKRYAAGI